MIKHFSYLFSKELTQKVTPVVGSYAPVNESSISSPSNLVGKEYLGLGISHSAAQALIITLLFSLGNGIDVGVQR